ncbi:GTP cyclohydrolase I FolE [Sodaliphilus sp.]|uniref:GTP cyclohydrolase I FolE n=1 Tax=Sodaliphilus sp. TaxID=2815818 RepID=UPI00388FD07B
MDNKQQLEQIAEHFRAIIELLGEDPNREGLVKTPMRAAKAMLENTRGYNLNATDIVRSAIFEHPGSQMVVVKDVEFYSLCEHHILPFFGTVSVGYIPDGEIVGLSKVGRIVDVFSRRLQVQERLTREICCELAQSLSAKGVIVVCEAQHLCMKMRGVEKQSSTTVTMHYTGAFEQVEYRNEFFAQLKR